MSATLTRRNLAALSAPEAEAGLLYAVLTARDGAGIPELAPAVWTVHRHRLVYEAARHLAAAGRPMELVAVAERLKARDELQAVGGWAGLSALTLPDAWAGTSNACAEVLREKARRRALAEAGERLARAASTPGGDPEAALARVAGLREERAAAPEPETGAAAWPELRPEALHGLAGDLVGGLDPYTEADQVAVLVQLLAAFGSAVGRGPHFCVGATKHRVNEYVVLVGETARGRKGTSWDEVRALLEGADEEWAGARVQSGLSSGEGLIWAVRDPITETNSTTHQQDIVDVGVADKRLLVIEPEFSAILRVCERLGNTLSAQIRQAWDSGMLRVLTKHQAARATDAHVSIMGHITRDELLRYLTATEQANGFANRFLWILVKRSKLLPEPGRMPDGERQTLTRRLREALDHARRVGEMGRDDDAREIWREAYPRLSADRLGLLGAVCSRAEAQTLRLSMLFALLDRSQVICPAHLLAGLAVWEYSEAAARLIFGDALGDGTSDELIRALRAAPQGLTRTEIRDHFGRNKAAAELSRGLRVLSEHGLASFERIETDGRPVERWHAVRAGTTKTTDTTKAGT